MIRWESEEGRGFHNYLHGRISVAEGVEELDFYGYPALRQIQAILALTPINTTTPSLFNRTKNSHSLHSTT